MAPIFLVDEIRHYYFERRRNVRLTPPTQIVWAISVLLVIIGLVAELVTIPTLSALSFWLVFIGALLLILATLLEGL